MQFLTFCYYSASFGVIWHYLVLVGICIRYHLVLHGTMWYYLVLFGIIFHCVVLLGATWYHLFFILYHFVSFCISLYGLVLLLIAL